MAAGGRLLAFKLPATYPPSDETTRVLIDDAEKYSKWQCVRDIDDFAPRISKLRYAMKLVRAIRDPTPAHPQPLVGGISGFVYSHLQTDRGSRWMFRTTSRPGLLWKINLSATCCHRLIPALR